MFEERKLVYAEQRSDEQKEGRYKDNSPFSFPQVALYGAADPFHEIGVFIYTGRCCIYHGHALLCAYQEETVVHEWEEGVNGRFSMWKESGAKVV
jgi:hypothetical protein